MFNALSELVKKGTYELEQVPNISNLKEVVSDQINAA